MRWNEGPFGRPRPLIECTGLAIGKHDGVATACGAVLRELPRSIPHFSIGRPYSVSRQSDMYSVRIPLMGLQDRTEDDRTWSDRSQR